MGSPFLSALRGRAAARGWGRVVKKSFQRTSRGPAQPTFRIPSCFYLLPSEIGVEIGCRWCCPGSLRRGTAAPLFFAKHNVFDNELPRDLLPGGVFFFFLPVAPLYNLDNGRIGGVGKRQSRGVCRSCDVFFLTATDLTVRE